MINIAWWVDEILIKSRPGACLFWICWSS